MLTTVASFTEPWEAHLFRLRLAAEGIPAVVANEHHVWAMWPYALALGGVKVQVAAENLAAAQDVWSRCRAGEYRAALAAELGDLDDAGCPRCRSAQFRSRRPVVQLLLLFVSYLCVGMIFPVRASVHRCGSCGTRWNDSLSTRMTLLSVLVAGLLLTSVYIGPAIFW
ncbi:MAG: hypothetical protein ACRD1H_13835 [Vicinamibacterales bacterium]